MREVHELCAGWTRGIAPEETARVVLRPDGIHTTNSEAVVGRCSHVPRLAVAAHVDEIRVRRVGDYGEVGASLAAWVDAEGAGALGGGGQVELRPGGPAVARAE